jgi:hypothetical protein
VLAYENEPGPPHNLVLLATLTRPVDGATGPSASVTGFNSSWRADGELEDGAGLHVEGRGQITNYRPGVHGFVEGADDAGWTAIGLDGRLAGDEGSNGLLVPRAALGDLDDDGETDLAGPLTPPGTFPESPTANDRVAIAGGPLDGASAMVGTVKLTLAPLDDSFFRVDPQIADFDGDGLPDLAAGLDGNVYLYSGPFGGGDLLPSDADLLAVDLASGPWGPSLSTTGDWDGDGYSDLAVGVDPYVNSARLGAAGWSGPFDSTRSAGDASFTFDLPAGGPSNFGTTWLETADLDGDGMDDLAIDLYGSVASTAVCAGPLAGQADVDSAACAFPAAAPGSTLFEDDAGSIGSVHDLDGDGQADLAITLADATLIWLGPVDLTRATP